ncbi:MAG: hypothetical protein ACOQNY_01720 [Mycoplasmoidaceae bacterium]
MKLLKKLLPIVGVASCATICGASIVSCKNDSAFAEWDFTKGSWHGTIPTKSGFLECTYQKGLEIYLEDCKNNMKIMAEDTITSAEVSTVLDDTRITYFGTRINNINTNDSRLSLTANYKRWIQDTETYGSLLKVTKVEIKNLKYKLMPREDQYDPKYFDFDPVLSPSFLYVEGEDGHLHPASDEEGLAAMSADNEWSVTIHEEFWSGLEEVQEFDYEFDSDYASQVNPNTDEAAHLFFRMNNVSFESGYMRGVIFYQEN